MAKIKMLIVDPKLLDGGTNAARVQMTYGETGSPIVLDTETALVECEAGGKSAPINKWKVDFGSHKMAIAGDNVEGCYSEIDFVTALGMAGQFVNEMGIEGLQKLIGTLKIAYDMRSGDAPSAPSDSENGVPDGKHQESPREPDLPPPVDPDEV